MNPNQPPNFQPYSVPFNNGTYINYQTNNQQQCHSNTHNIQPTQYLHQNNHTQNLKNDYAPIQRTKVDKAMYCSTIETTNNNKNFTFGKLEAMGRFVSGEENKNESLNKNFAINNKPKFDLNQPVSQTNPYSFKTRDEKLKMATSFIAPSTQSSTTDFDRFPSFNLQEQNKSSNIIQSRQPKEQLKVNEDKTNQTPQQKRRREILAIKQELDMINKKMQSSNLNKKYTNDAPKNQGNQYSKNTNGTTHNISGNQSSNFTNNNANYLTQMPSKNFNQQKNYDSYGNNYGAQLQGQKNKGMIAKSMIVDSRHPQGYKFQNIFDKYDSMKKPNYQTENNNDSKKQDKPLLLDQFVKKGNNLNQIEGEKKNGQPSLIHINTSQNLNQVTNIQSKKQYEQISTNLTSTNNLNINHINTFVKPINSNQFSSSISANIIPTQGSTETNMFKKKKQSIQIQDASINNYNFSASINEIKNTNTMSSPKNSGGTEGLMFNKTKQRMISANDNFVTSALKKMNIQESISFKKDDFVVGKKLGKGQFGQVMLVQHKKTGFLCGMKVMEKKQIIDEKYEGQISRQLSIQFYLAHRNIAPLYGYFQDEKNVYLLVEYCTGGQLLQMLRKNRRMEEPQVSRVIRQIIEGIDYIHKELIIHRDIKPENILFNFGVAKICDFGWAVYKGHGMRKTASVGSPLYYSPEIVMGVQYDEKIDIWDIGMMTYECLLGKIPFRIYSELDLNRIVEDEIKFPQYIDTSDEAKDFILKIMKKKPEERMQIRQMLRHSFVTKYQDQKLAIQIMKDIKDVLS